MTMPQALTALVVDDVKENRIILSRLLERQEFKTVAVESGALAIQSVSEQHFDIIFMDVMMPEMSGIDATKIIRSKGYKGPIIAVTAATSEEANCLAVGMNDFITKPVLFNNFINKIPVWLSKKEEEKEKKE